MNKLNLNSFIGLIEYFQIYVYLYIHLHPCI